MSPGARDPECLPAREAAERRAQLRGLLLLALAAVAFVLVRFGPARIFTPGWWRLW